MPETIEVLVTFFTNKEPTEEKEVAEQCPNLDLTKTAWMKAKIYLKAQPEKGVHSSEEWVNQNDWNQFLAKFNKLLQTNGIAVVRYDSSIGKYIQTQLA